MATSVPRWRPRAAGGRATDVAHDQQTARPGLWPRLDDRIGLSALRYPVPAHANAFWYTLGGITLVGVVVLGVTGLWLAQDYNPDPTGARASVMYIQNTAPFGDVVRGVHVWMAYLVVLTASLHLVRVFVTGAYKAPRELNWLVGLALLATLLFGGVLTGTVLRWDQAGYEALARNAAAASLLGGVGGFFSPGFTSSVSMLPRLYAAHVSITPLGLALLLIAHILLVKRHDLAPTRAQADAGEAPGGRLPRERLAEHFPIHLRKSLGYGLAVVGLAGTLGVLFPQRIGPAPDPMLEVTNPPFLFYWLYAVEDWFGSTGTVYSALALFGVLGALPLIDRSPSRSLHRRRVRGRASYTSRTPRRLVTSCAASTSGWPTWSS